MSNKKNNGAPQDLPDKTQANIARWIIIKLIFSTLIILAIARWKGVEEDRQRSGSETNRHASIIAESARDTAQAHNNSSFVSSFQVP